MRVTVACVLHSTWWCEWAQQLTRRPLPGTVDHLSQVVTACVFAVTAQTMIKQLQRRIRGLLLWSQCLPWPGGRQTVVWFSCVVVHVAWFGERACTGSGVFVWGFCELDWFGASVGSATPPNIQRPGQHALHTWLEPAAANGSYATNLRCVLGGRVGWTVWVGRGSGCVPLQQR